MQVFCQFDVDVSDSGAISWLCVCLFLSHLSLPLAAKGVLKVMSEHVLSVHFHAWTWRQGLSSQKPLRLYPCLRPQDWEALVRLVHGNPRISAGTSKPCLLFE